LDHERYPRDSGRSGEAKQATVSMNAIPIKLGMLVRDDHGRQGIVCSRKERPPQDWIDEQLRADDIRKLDPSVPWGD